VFSNARAIFNSRESLSTIAEKMRLQLLRSTSFQQQIYLGKREKKGGTVKNTITTKETQEGLLSVTQCFPGYSHSMGQITSA
jgi:hypothetical protein